MFSPAARGSVHASRQFTLMSQVYNMQLACQNKKYDGKGLLGIGGSRNPNF